MLTFIRVIPFPCFCYLASLLLHYLFCYHQLSDASMEAILFMAANLTSSRERVLQKQAASEGLLDALLAFISGKESRRAAGGDDETIALQSLAMTVLSNLTLRNNETAEAIATSSFVGPFFLALLPLVETSEEAQEWLVDSFELPSLHHLMRRPEG